MESASQHIEILLDSASDYADTQLSLWKLKWTARVADKVSSLATSATVWSILIIAGALLTIATALFLGDYFGRIYYGFFIMAGVYAIAGLVINFSGKKRIRNRLKNVLIRELLKETV